MPSHKPFKTQGHKNPLKAFKQTSQKSTLTNNHIQNSNYLKTFQVCPQTLKSDPLNSKQLQTVQIRLCSLATLKSDPLEASTPPNYWRIVLGCVGDIVPYGLSTLVLTHTYK